MEGRGLSEPPPPPPPALPFSPPPSLSLALPPPRTLRRREGELPGVLRGELLAVLETGKNKTKKKDTESKEDQRSSEETVSFFIATFCYAHAFNVKL